MQQDWRQAGIEPAIDNMLADPIVHAVMRRDGLQEVDIRAVIARASPRAALLVAAPRARAGQGPR